MENNEFKKILETQEYDRKRIVNELHDTSLQTLAHLTHKIELASMYIDKDQIRAKLELAEVNKELRSVIDEIRDTIFNIRPMSFDDLGLKETIQRNIAVLNGRSGIKFVADIEEIDIDDDFVKLQIFRVLQELLRNSEKHSAADEIRIRLYQDEHIHMIIEDNGVGMDTDNIPGTDDSHFGLSIVKERLSSIGGVMSIDSAEDKGTKITIDI